MAKSIVDKKREDADRAAAELGLALLEERENERKADNGRKIKLGAAVIELMKHDAQLLSRMEEAIKKAFASRKVDRLHFRLDDTLTWFDDLREEAHEAAASAPAAVSSAPPRSAQQPKSAAATPAAPPSGAVSSVGPAGGAAPSKGTGAPLNGTASA